MPITEGQPTATSEVTIEFADRDAAGATAAAAGGAPSPLLSPDAAEVWQLDGPREATSHTARVRADLDALIDGLEPVIGRDAYFELEAAINALEVAVRLEYVSRLVHLAVAAAGAGGPGILIVPEPEPPEP